MSAGNDREFIDNLQKREGGKVMKCPLLMQAAMYMSPAEADMLADCLKEECAWWCYNRSCCAIFALVGSVEGMMINLNRIEEKMPHAGQFLQKP